MNLVRGIKPVAVLSLHSPLHESKATARERGREVFFIWRWRAWGLPLTSQGQVGKPETLAWWWWSQFEAGGAKERERKEDESHKICVKNARGKRWRWRRCVCVCVCRWFPLELRFLSLISSLFLSLPEDDDQISGGLKRPLLLVLTLPLLIEERSSAKSLSSLLSESFFLWQQCQRSFPSLSYTFSYSDWNSNHKEKEGLSLRETGKDFGVWPFIPKQRSNKQTSYYTVLY